MMLLPRITCSSKVQQGQQNRAAHQERVCAREMPEGLPCTCKAVGPAAALFLRVLALRCPWGQHTQDAAPQHQQGTQAGSAAPTTMPMSVLVFMSTVWSSTTFMNWSKPRSVPVTCRLALRMTAGRSSSGGGGTAECVAAGHQRADRTASAAGEHFLLDSFLSMNFLSSGGWTLGILARAADVEADQQETAAGVQRGGC